MPVHLFGLVADMEPILALADEHGLAVIEDACQAHGAEYRGKRAGSFGTATFSFYPTKNMTTGEGGIIATSDEAIAETCQVIRQHGMRRLYYHDELGFNFRMTDVHAAIGLAQVQKLDRFNNARIANAAFFSTHLGGVTVPVVPEECRHVFHQYTVRVPSARRDGMVDQLRERGIGTMVYYPVPVHQQRVYRELGYSQALPEAERAAQEVLSLPVHPGLSSREVDTVIEAVNELSAGEGDHA